IAVPCNTAEYFIDGHHFDATMLDIVCETVRFMQSKSVKTVGILSTDGTIASEIYSSKFHGCAVNIVYPSIAEQQKITDAIYKNVKSGLGGESGISDICHSLFWRGCDAVILGCTELSLLDMSKFDLLDRIFDPMDILAISSIKQCGYDSKGFDKKYDMV
ncbi:MAG: amino acid racemase, partial [Clostridia bacterium]|nr:amino acid racemase [Clostridia bacterium]